jgi:hypothetical protein
MKITHIIGEQGVQPQLCKNGMCPAAIITDDGTVYVQGAELGEAERAQLSAPPGEGFVRMPLSVLKRITAHLKTV